MVAKPVLADQDHGGVARITNLPAPASANEPARLADLNSAVEGLAWKDSVRVRTAANVNLAAPGANLDGIAMAANDRFLAGAQTTTSQNGIYIWNGAAVPATRALDANSANELEQAIVPVEEGTSAGTQWRQTQVNFVLDTDPIAFVSFGTSAPAATEAAAGIARVATQPLTDAGANDTDFLTPLKLANWSGRARRAAGTIGDGAATSFALNHNLNTRDVTVSVYRNSGVYDDVICGVERTTVNQITLTFASAPALNSLRVVVTA
jgi:hypothetical protein